MSGSVGLWAIAGLPVATQRSVFSPAGPGATAIAGLGLITLALLGVAAVATLGLIIWLGLRRRGTLAEHASIDSDGGQSWILYGGFVTPAIVLPILFILGISTLDRFPLHDELHGAADIRVTAHQWWWEVTYLGLSPSQQVKTANEIHIPVGQPVDFALESADVIHSFWVPRLHGKVDLIPGIENHLRLQADVAGTYEGQCGDFCGTNHSQMHFIVVAESPEQFAAWLAGQAKPAADPQGPQALLGHDLFQGKACALCHTVRGTEASGSIGPDLTHLGSRQRLAAGMLPNNHAYLLAWMTRAQSFKPGAQMPDLTDLSGTELEALYTYLRGLH